jgi:uncharacterized protein (TIGR01777 family)
MMGRKIFRKRSRIEAPAEELFNWHGRPGAFERLSPPWDPVQIVERVGGMQDGGRVVLRLPVAGPISVRWVAEHADYVEGESFRDVQSQGPFNHWSHTHSFAGDGDGASVLEDEIEYELPLGIAGDLIAGRAVKSRLREMFAYRHRITRQDIATLTRTEVKPMKILITGSNGLVGSSLIPFLTTAGHEVVRLVRRAPRGDSNDFQWDLDSDRVDEAAFEGVDAVVHLAGETIDGRWTDSKKKKIEHSRVRGTSLLARTLAGLSTPPSVLIASSAVGYYGDRGAAVLTEQSSKGSGFLADVCEQWEDATAPATEKGIRAVNLRTAPVLTPRGGPLGRLLTPFRLGLGGPVGSGEQYFPWISIDDLVGVIYHAITSDGLRGPVNAVAPQQVTNRELAKTLGRVLGRPALLPLPAFVVRAVFGEMGEELLLASQRVEPERLVHDGYSYRFPELEDALRHLLGKTRRDG